MKRIWGRRRIQKGELKNVDVDLISLLFDEVQPANMKSAVIKSADGRGSYKPFAVSAKFKSETVGDKGLLYVTVMEPGVKDAQGDSYSPEEVEKAAYNFLKKGTVGKNDVNHNNVPVPEFVIAESYILKAEDKAHFPNTKVGSWVAVLKCEDLGSELWQKVKKGQFNGVSIAGYAEDGGADNNALVAELKGQLDEIKKALGENPGAESQKALDVLKGRIVELEKADQNTESEKLIRGLTKEMKELSMALTKAISKSLKGEPGVVMDADHEVMIDGNKIIVKAKKRDLYKGIADVDGGRAMNILTPNTTTLFIDEVIGSQPGDTLSDITVVPLLKDEKIDAGVVADLVFKNAADGAIESAQDIGTGDITVTTGILHAEFTLGRDVVEFYKDKYGEEAFGAYVENHIAKKAEKAMRKLLFSGDRSSGTAALKGLDGVVKLATTAAAVTSIDSEEHVNWDERFEAALLAFDAGILEDQERMVFYVSHKDHVRLRSEIARRPTSAGDRFLLEGGKVSFGGIPVKPRLMADSYIIAGLGKFIILGYRTDAELKVEHHGSDWKYHWYIRIRPGIAYVDGFVKVFKVE